MLYWFAGKQIRNVGVSKTVIVKLNKWFVRILNDCFVGCWRKHNDW
jgi:hypothetical protein